MSSFMQALPYRTDLSIEEAVDLLLEYSLCPAEEKVPIERASGRVLAQEFAAREMMPPFARSPYDGYAFRGEDTESANAEHPAVFRVVEEIRAGSVPTRVIGPFEAAKILTGGPIPAGANATIKYEDTAFDEATVSIFKPIRPNTDIVPAGEDVNIGDVIARKGEVLAPPHIGLLAGLGVAEVPVFRAPKIAIISTGDELLDAKEALLPGKIRNSSYYALRAYMEREGMQVMPCRYARDTVETIGQAIREACASADVVLTTGGVSVGDYDVVRAAAQSVGATALFWKVRMKPGSAVLAALLDGKMILGLSGNPAAAVIGLHMLALPFIRSCAGQKNVRPERIQAVLRQAFPKKSVKHRLVPGRLLVEGSTVCFDRKERLGNAVLSSLIGFDLLAEIPAGTPPLPEGTVVTAYKIER